jgi:hypothetical protein
MKAQNIKEIFLELLLVLCAFLSFAPIYSFISIGVFIINFIYFKIHLKPTWTFFSIAIAVNIIFFGILKPKSDELFEKNFHLGFHENATQITINHLDTLNKMLNEYKEENGYLPHELADVKHGFIDLWDMSYIVKNKPGDIIYADFYYERIDSNKYHLLSIGYDGKAKTKDDILPSISDKDTLTTGLIRYTIKKE